MDDLRQQAEKRLEQQDARLHELSKEDMDRLVHELGTHQIELEIQNEELRRAQHELEESRRKYSDLYDFAPIGYLSLDRDGYILEANHTIGIMLNRPKRTLTGKRIFDFIDRHDHRIFFKHLEDTLIRQSRQTCEARLKKYGAADFYARFESIIAEDGERAAHHIRTAVIDISEKKHAELALQRSEKRFRSIFDNVAVGIVIADTERRIVDCNPMFHKMLGYAKEELIGRHAAVVTHPDDEPENALLFKRTLEERRGGFRMQKRYLRKDGSTIWGDLIVSFVYDERGRPDFIVAMISDITEHIRMEETIRHQAYHDALTGLPNRMLFTDLLISALNQAHRNKKILAVMFLDLDRFKVINDTMGHTFGDKLLQAVAEMLRRCVRESDIVARIGGDEFTILLPSISHAEDAAKIAQKIMEQFKKPFAVNDHELHVTMSIGISLYPNDGEHMETLLKNADIALYHIKEFGRNNYAFYDSAMNVRTLERMILENSLRQTLQRGELVVYYQPQIDIRTRQIICTEALVRWRHPELGLLNPMQFLPLAEETGFIVSLDEWVLRTACEQNKRLQEAGHPSLCVTVNLSARQFQQSNLVEMVEHALHDTGLEPRYLLLEVTESTAMKNMDITFSNLTRLARMGVKCSIDDFGTGYSSLSYLKRLPLQSLKIDKSFIRDIASSPDDKAIITAIVAMAHSMKMNVIAEGVETEEQLAFLQSVDCDEMQGFLISEPLPVEELEKVIELYK
ncbi:MAG: EAL domain-containing protein [Nitrospirota bacterium]